MIGYSEMQLKQIQQKGIVNINTKLLKKPQRVSLLNRKDEILCVSVGCVSENITQGRSHEIKDVFLSHCFFFRTLTFYGHGDVIFIDDGFGSQSMYVIYTMFYNCISSGYGGAIYFYSWNSCIRMICANRCSASERHFAYLTATQMNQVEYLSESYFSHTSYGKYSIQIRASDQRVDNTNINSSMNFAEYYSGIAISSSFSFISSYCTFSNNKVSNSICISLDSGTLSMLYSNIVHNNSPSQYGVVYRNGAGSIKMMYCIFKNNQNTLFCVFGVPLEVLHSFIDHSGSFSTYSAVLTTNNSFTNRITYQLQFFNSFRCNTDYPERSIENTPKNTIHRSHSECVFTLQLSNWREISVVFSFAFLFPVIILMIS